MRKIIVLEFLSLDGVMQGPGAPEEDSSGGFEYGGWTVPYFDEFAATMMSGQMQPPFALLLGRKTFEIFAGYWPKHADGWSGINAATKYVASNTLTVSDWQNSVFLSGDIVTKLQKLKQEDGPDLQVWGSGNLLQTLLKHDLVDEFKLKIFPVILGKGKRLFENGVAPAAFTLTESKISPSGVIFINYTRSGKVTTGSF